MTAKLHTGGTHRTIDPAQTIKNAEPHLAAMGITRIANVTGLDRLGIPVVNAYRPNSRSLSVSQGKGQNLASAKASAIMEAIEGYHAEQIDLPLKRGSYNELAESNRLIDISGLAFLANAEFDPDRPLHWIEGVDLVSEEAVLLPFELVHTDYTVNAPDNARCFVASTNGLASGNHRTEAIVHGICEVIERDAHTLWELTPTTSKAETRVNLSSITDPSCQWLIQSLQKSGMTVGVWDMTSDVRVATFYCLIIDDRFGGHSGAGAGTHIDASIALSRAITEAVQVRTNYITGARDDLERGEYDGFGLAQKKRYAKSLFEAPSVHLTDFTDVPSKSLESFEADIGWLLKQLSKVDVNKIVSIELTKPDFGIPVERIVIPGLEGPHDHDDYCPGRRARSLIRRFEQ
ncbi:MAG: YcaO-like family protein [Pseudomonadota bacterium]